MPSPPSITRADTVIRDFMARTARLVTLDTRGGRATARELLRVLRDADRDMERRLNWWVRHHGGGAERRFSEASLVAYRAQITEVIGFVERRLLGMTGDQALAAAATSLRRTSSLINNLEEAFTGIASPLRLDEALITRLEPSLLARSATSVDRYGTSMITRMQEELAKGFASNMTQGQMVDRLINMGGPRGAVSMRAVEVSPSMVVRVSQEMIPEGLFVRYRGWAWRVVRTEVAEAQNAASQLQATEAAKVFPDMKRKILAVMDKRTAADSLGVHGQVRGLRELFTDGAGRQYLRPPSRPNDRETLIPWRERWPSTSRSRPLSQARQRELNERNQAWQAERTRARRRRRATDQYRMSEASP